MNVDLGPIDCAPSPRLRRGAWFNRELSWLAFNRRVLEQAVRERHPLLERAKFLAIVASNLDEFFEIRVAGLVQQVEDGSTSTGADGLEAREQLRRIHSVSASMVEHLYRCWQYQVRPALEAEGLRFRRADELEAAESRWVRQYFRREIKDALSPVAVDAAHPFPEVANKTLHLLCSLNLPETPQNERLMAIVPVPRALPRLVEIGPGRDGARTFMFIASVIKLGLADLFPGHEVSAAHTFRVTRNSDLYIDEEEADNLLASIEAELRNRRRGAPVRLEVEGGVHPGLFGALLEKVGLAREYVFQVDGPVDFQALFDLPGLARRPDLLDPPHRPARARVLAAAPDVFARLREGDVLLHHPYESFDPVVDFIVAAARDPQVLALKLTLYRTSGDSPIVAALEEAARAGKQVTALVELKARFDEANNIVWARRLEEAGAHVVYGIVGYKVHSKVCLVVRREGRALRTYLHLGTGNYNPRTARIYTDLSLLTARAHLGAEASALFHALTGFGRAGRFRHLWVAPYNLHARTQRAIRREAARARAGQPARIVAKVNSLVDPQTILNLYDASRAGVEIDLVVRGICGLVPGVPGLSDRIRVRSIVGRYLEHSRIFLFGAGADAQLLLGSADWMPRNFFRRVETVFPVEDPALATRVRDEILGTLLADDLDARILAADGSYRPPAVPDGTTPRLAAQDVFLRLAREGAAGQENDEGARKGP